MVPWDSGAVTQYLRDLGYLDAELTDTSWLSLIKCRPLRTGPAMALAYDGMRNDRAVIRYEVEPVAAISCVLCALSVKMWCANKNCKPSITLATFLLAKHLSWVIRTAVQPSSAVNVGPWPTA